ncbi:MAG: hypothetical protein K9K88_05010 [Desulfobacterales bacterium]|nr:hypothetical protein [Desulfobacterales bacterium]
MSITAKETDIKRSTERLYGILSGITADCEITDLETAQLKRWLDENEYLHCHEPFASVADKLNEFLEDQIVDEDEREELLDWCGEISDHMPACVTSAIRRLHGVLHGISVDGIVTENEVLGLHDWLLDHEVFRYHWPFDETWSLVERILEDKIVDHAEAKELLEFCQSFSETRIKIPSVHDELYKKGFMKTEAAVLKPFSALCNRSGTIVFKMRSFCFTGPARTGPRRILHEVVEDLEGIPADRVTPNLDYLVIGAQSSPAWAYSTYGRKIEAVLENRKAGSNTDLLHEDDFVTAAKKYVPDPSIFEIEEKDIRKERLRVIKSG